MSLAMSVALAVQEQMFQPLLAVRHCSTVQAVVVAHELELAVRQATAQAATALQDRQLAVVLLPQTTDAVAVAAT